MHYFSCLFIFQFRLVDLQVEKHKIPLLILQRWTELVSKSRKKYKKTSSKSNKNTWGLFWLEPECIKDLREWIPESEAPAQHCCHNCRPSQFSSQQSWIISVGSCFACHMLPTLEPFCAVCRLWQVMKKRCVSIRVLEMCRRRCERQFKNSQS